MSELRQYFKSRIEEENFILEFNQFNKYLSEYELGRLDELSLPSWFKEKIDFIKSLAEIVGQEVSTLFALFKNSKVYKFFKLIGWSLVSLFKLVKTGYEYYKKAIDGIAEFVAKTGVVKWTTEKLKELDEFMKKHPVLSKITGVAVAGILVFIWMKMSFTGDFIGDFDISDVLAALTGKFILSTIFGGTQGTKLILLFTTGLVGLSFPWPGPQSIQFIVAILTALAKSVGIKIPKLKT